MLRFIARRRSRGAVRTDRWVLAGADERSAVATQLRAAGCIYAEDEADVLLRSARSPVELQMMIEQRVVGRPLEHVVLRYPAS